MTLAHFLALATPLLIAAILGVLAGTCVVLAVAGASAVGDAFVALRRWRK